MTTPERFRRDEKTEITEEEQDQLNALNAAADAARNSGISDPDRVEGENK